MSSPRSEAWSGVDVDSDEEMDWEDVSMHPVAPMTTAESLPGCSVGDQAADPSTSKDVKPTPGNIEITLTKAQKSDPKRK